MPSFQYWLSEVVDHLRDGRSVIVVLPDGVDTDVVRAALWAQQDHLYYEGIFLAELGRQRPVEAVVSALALEIDRASMDRLVVQSGLPDVLFLDDFDELGEADRVPWLQFIVQWAEACQGKRVSNRGASMRTSTLCLVTHASSLPREVSLSTLTNVLLATQVWWGVPTVLEMRLLARLVCQGGGAFQRRWQECLIPSLAGNDLALAEYMLVHEFRSLPELVEGLLTFAKGRGWSDEDLGDAWLHGSWWDETSIMSGRLWSYPFFGAWARGMVYWTPEYGLEVHSSGLAALGRHEVVEHRYWRGQAQLIVPQIDEMRLALCRTFTRSYGTEWPYRWIQPKNKGEREAVRRSPFACQLGHLEHLLRCCRSLRKESRWYSLVSKARTVRNDLSHYRGVTLDTYMQLCREAERGIREGLAMPSW